MVLKDVDDLGTAISSLSLQSKEPTKPSAPVVIPSSTPQTPSSQTPPNITSNPIQTPPTSKVVSQPPNVSAVPPQSIPTSFAPAQTKPSISRNHAIQCIFDWYRLGVELQRLNTIVTHSKGSNPSVTLMQNQINQRMLQLIRIVQTYEMAEPGFIATQWGILERTYNTNAGAAHQLPTQSYPSQPHSQHPTQATKPLQTTQQQPIKPVQAHVTQDVSLPERSLISSLYKRIQHLKDEEIEPRDGQQPPEVKLNLLPYQIQGLNWLKRTESENATPKGGLLCDDMGLGKTVSVFISRLILFRFRYCP